MSYEARFKAPFVIKAEDGTDAVTYEPDGAVRFHVPPILESADLDDDLDAVAALSATGLAARTGAGAWAARTLTGSSGQITVANGDGVSGNPTFSFASPTNTAWTPAATFDTPDDATFTAVSGNVGRALKWGPLVFCSCWGIWTSNAYTGSPSGAFRLSGMPYAMTTPPYGINVSRWVNIDLAAGAVGFGGQENGGTLRFFTSGDAAGIVTLGPTHFPASTTFQMVLDFWYATAD